MNRFWRFVRFMTVDRGELLPLSDFSPMENRQTNFLDKLIHLKDGDNAAKNIGNEPLSLPNKGGFAAGYARTFTSL